MIRILIVDDSASTRELLKELLSADEQIQVIGSAHNGTEALYQTRQLKPDLILMDIQMPGLDGIQAAKVIMKEMPTPIVMISAAVDRRDSKLATEAFEAGVLAVLNKPPGPTSPNFAAASSHIIATIKAIAAVKPVGRSGQYAQLPDLRTRQPCRIIAIASSVGGPAALQKIFSHLSPDIGVPIMVVQHIAEGFISSLISWLQTSSQLPIMLAKNGEPLQAGYIYMAPDKCHLQVARGHIDLSHEKAIKGFQPSATALFTSVANEYTNSCVAAILTGMGDDGVAGLTKVKETKGLVLAQDQASSVVFGMNGEAIDRGLADVVLPLSDIATFLTQLPKHGRGGN